MKKLLAILLALTMVFGCLGTFSVYAAETPPEVNNLKFAALDFVPGADGKSPYIDTTNINKLTIHGVWIGAFLGEVVGFVEGYDFVSLVTGNGTYTDKATALETCVTNGSKLVIRNSQTLANYEFTFVIYGDPNCDGAIDVVDAFATELLASGARTITEIAENYSSIDVDEEIIETSVDIDGDGVISVTDYQVGTNIAVDETSFDQKRIDTEEANKIDPVVEAQVYSGAPLEPVSEVEFNNLALTAGDDYEISYSENTETGLATVTITGKGLFAGTVVKTFKITDVLGKTVDKVDRLLDDSGLGSVFTASYDDVTAKVTLDVNAGELFGGNFSMDSSILTGILPKIHDYFDTTLAGVTDITVLNNSIFNGETISNSALKSTLFSLAAGFFTNIANMSDDGTVKTFDGSYTENEVVKTFSAALTVSGSDEDIASVKSFATKFANHLAFENVGGNAVVTVKMPQGFVNTLVDIAGEGDIAAAKAWFDTLSVAEAFAILEGVTAEDFAPSTASFTSIINAVASLDGFINKLLTKVSAASITDTAGNTYTALSSGGFSVADDAENKFGAFAGAVGNALSDDVRATKTGDYYYENGVYKVEFDVSVDVSNLGLMSGGIISEKIVVLLDIFNVTDSQEPAAESGGSFKQVSVLPTLAAGADAQIIESDAGIKSAVYGSNNNTVTLSGCPLAFILDESGKIINLDYNTNVLSGIPLGANSADSFISLPENSPYQLSVDYSYEYGELRAFSTGSVVKLMSGGVAEHSYTVSVPGDVNGDGVIDVLDITVIEIVTNNADRIQLNDAQKEAVAAITDDGEQNISDFQIGVNAALSGESIEAPRKTPIADSGVSNPEDVIYNTYRQEPAVTAEVNGEALTSGVDYTLTYSDNINAGTAKIIVEGIGDYVGRVERTFNIDKKTITADELSYTSEIVANSGTNHEAGIEYDDITLKDCINVEYNGSNTVSSASGIYIVKASVNNSNYNDASFTLGTLTIAPKSVSGEFRIDVDNDNRVIVVNIIKPYAADAKLLAQLETLINTSAYTLKRGNVELTSVTSQALNSRSYDVYAGQTSTNITITPTSNILGGLLLSDEQLWANALAPNNNYFYVTAEGISESFTVRFIQDEAGIILAKRAMLSQIGAYGRGNRTGGTGGDVLCYGKMGTNGYPSVRVAANNTSASCKNALGGTGLKTMLVGYKDALSVQASSSTDFSGKTITTLYETSNNNYRYTNYTGTGVVSCLPAVNAVLKGMGISFTTVGLILSNISKFIDQVGYCNYLCSESTLGLRYNNVYYLEFRKFAAAEDAHHTLNVNAPTNGTVAVSSEIPSTAFSLMAKGELVKLTVTPKSGYSLSEITVTDGDNNNVAVTYENGFYYFYMPASDATVNATFA